MLRHRFWLFLSSILLQRVLSVILRASLRLHESFKFRSLSSSQSFPSPFSIASWLKHRSCIFSLSGILPHVPGSFVLMASSNNAWI